MNRYICLNFSLLMFISFSLNAYAVIFEFEGTLVVADPSPEAGNNSGVFSSTALGTLFEGTLDSSTQRGEIGDGTQTFAFDLPPEQGEIFRNNEFLSPGFTNYINGLAGESIVRPGELVDLYSIGGIGETQGSGTLALDTFYILDSGTFSNALPNDVFFNPQDVLASVFLLTEKMPGIAEEGINNPITTYTGSGLLNLVSTTVVPLPASAWLLLIGLATLLMIRRARF